MEQTHGSLRTRWSLKYLLLIMSQPCTCSACRFSKLFVPCSYKKARLQKQTYQSLQRLSKCCSFRLTVSKSWEENSHKWRPNRDLIERLNKAVSSAERGKQMRQHSSKIPFISVIHHFLKQNGVNVSRDKLNDCYHILLEHNPSFPQEGTLYLDIWKRVKNNVLRAYWQGVPIPPQLWVT